MGRFAEAVRLYRMQRKLKEDGVYSGPIDGWFARTSLSAIWSITATPN
jgi:hypothetical protein